MNQTSSKYPSTFTMNNFNSTTELATNEIKLPMGSNDTINNNTNDDYEPFEHRKVEHPTPTSGAFIHLMKGCLGTGILAMPNAFKNGGLLFGIVATIIVGIVCTHCLKLLVSASHKICKRSKQPVLGFSETAGGVFEYGPKKLRPWATTAKLSVDLVLGFVCFFGLSVLIVFISLAIYQVVDFHYPELGWDVIPYIFMVLVPLVVCVQIRELKFLVPFSFVANICMVTSFAITFYYIFVGFEMRDDIKYVGTIETIPMFFGTIIFAIEAVPVVMPIENNMKKPQHFLGCPGVLNAAMICIILFYSVIGIFGYLKYGADTKASITYNIPVEDVLAQVAKILIAFAVFLTYCLQFYVPMDLIWRNVLENKIPVQHHNLAQIVTRSLFVICTAGIAAGVPQLDAIIGLMGSIGLSLLGLFIPAFVDTILRLEDGFGWLKWRLFKNIILMLFALAALIFGSYSSINVFIQC